MVQVSNWAGNVVFAARRLHHPDSVEQLQALVAGSDRLRVLGTGHSFNRIADTTGDLVSLAAMPTRLQLHEPGADGVAHVTVGAGTRYAELAAFVHERGWALHNLGSLPHISVAGACSTGTHGSGVRNGSLATAVRGMQLVTPDGGLLTLGADHPDLAGSVVALGALGVVTSLTLALEPAYDVRQLVYDDVPHEALTASLGDVLAADHSVSAFTDWADPLRWQLWRKQRVDADPGDPPARYVGGTLADGPRHPVAGVDPVHCTQQLGVPGPWHERLPHFRREFTPSSGAELQSEWFVPLHLAREAVEAVAAVRAQVAPLVQVGELRTVAADDLWLSPAQGRDSLAVHVTWVLDEPAVAVAVRVMEAALAPFAPRPHWAKVFATDPLAVRALYPRWDDFADLLHRRDPGGVLRGDFVGAYFPLR